MAKTFDADDWYWTVAGDTASVFSSAVGDYVPVSDPAFVSWSGDGTLPTPIATEAELGEVLAYYDLVPVEAGVLDGFRDAQASTLATRVLAEAMFYMANEIRALKGQQPITKNQFKDFLKSLI